MYASLLPLLCVLVGRSAALIEDTMGHREEFDLTPHAICNEIAQQQLQDVQRGVEEGVKSILMVTANLTDLVSTHLTLDDRCMQGVQERENATRRLLDTLDQLEYVNKVHRAENLKLKQENTHLQTLILLFEDNENNKNEASLAQEIAQLISKNRQVEEDSRRVKTRNRELELAETQAQERVKTALKRIAQLERETRQLKEMNNNTAGKKRLVEEQLSVTDRERSTGDTTAKDCAELYCRGERLDGVYFIKPDRDGPLLSTWCDMTTDGGGWTVFLQRDIKVHPGVNFTRDWQAYKTGFGNPATEYWLGTEALHQLTRPSPQTVRLAATNKQGDHRWALWSTFSIADENTGYQLLVDGYQEESTMGDVLVRHHNLNGMKFSTIDKDNDIKPGESCALDAGHLGGWWYRNCVQVYVTRPHRMMRTRYWTPGVQGSGWGELLQKVQMMTRPNNFPTSHQ